MFSQILTLFGEFLGVCINNRRKLCRISIGDNLEAKVDRGNDIALLIVIIFFNVEN